MTGTAIIAGGSVGGLFAAAELLKAGWTVRVFERAEAELAGRGAGIVTHAPLLSAFEAVGASLDSLGVPVEDRVAIDIAGKIVKKTSYPQIVTSWDRIHQILRALMPDDTYKLGRVVSGYDMTGGHVSVLLDDGSQESADLLVGADGFRSAVRGQMLPKVQPAYSGYVVWRAVADEASFPKDAHEKLFSDFGFFAPNGSQVLGYPIPGADNDIREGRRRYNFVCYRAATSEALAGMLTDAGGTQHSMTIPPPLVRDDVLARMLEDAKAAFPRSFLEIIQACDRPFFTPIYDHCSPVFASGRVALLGDAACVARPHAGMGVLKAAQDARALSRCLSAAPVEEALMAYSEARVPPSRRAYEEARKLGSYIFDTDPEANRDGRDNPHINAIVNETAIPII